MLASKRLRRTVALSGAVIAGLLVSSLPPAAPVARADTFQPPPDPPTVTSVSISSNQSGTFTGITPAWQSSTEIYTVSAQISAPSSLVGIQSVQMCLWLQSANDCDATYDQTTEPDPRKVFIMEWDWDKSADQSANTDDYSSWTERFSITGTNNYGVYSQSDFETDGSPASNTPSGTTSSDPENESTMTVDFSFVVSNVMQHSNDWTARVKVTDTADQVGENQVENVLVNYFGSVTTNRSPLSYGALSEVSRVSSVQEDQPLGQYTANSQSDITIEATDFSGPGETLELDPSVNNQGQKNQGQGVGPVVLRCSPGSTFDNASAQIIDSGAEFFGATVPILQTEAAEEIGPHSCQLRFPRGQIKRPNVQYSNTVTVAIAADELTAPGNLSLVSSSDGESVALQWDQPIAANQNGVTMSSYVIERSDDGGSSYSTIDEINSSFSNQMSYTDTGLTPGEEYFYRVTANIADIGAGDSVESITTNSAGETLALMKELNDTLSGYTYNTTTSTVVSAIEGLGFKVFAIPTTTQKAETLSSQSGTLSVKGRFSTGVMQNRGAAHYLAESEGFADNRLNGHPYIGFVAMTGTNYLGSGVMLYRNYNSTTHLRELFYPTAWRNLYGAVLDSGNSADQVETYLSTSTQTIFSNNQRPGYFGYYSSSRFSADDGVWGFASGRAVNGNSSSVLSSIASGRYGVQNSDGSDTDDKRLYWDSSTYSTSQGVLYFFVRYNE